MADARKCDRCGNYYTLKEKKFKDNDRMVHGIAFIDEWGAPTTRYDLCDKCCSDLIYFMSGEPVVVGASIIRDRVVVR